MPRAKANAATANETGERKHLLAMSSLTSYNRLVSPKHKPLAIIHGVIIPEVFEKKTQKTPKRVISVCKRRLKEYDDD